MELVHREFLPTPTRSSHASTIEFWNGHPVFAWFGGTREQHPDVGIFIYNLNGDGKTITIGRNDGMPRWNPILYRYEDQLFLFKKAGEFCDRWQTFLYNITDWDSSVTDEKIRRDVKVLPAGINGPVKTRPIELDYDNMVACGSAVETFCDWASYIEFFKYDYEEKTLEFFSRSKPLTVPKKGFTDRRGNRRATSGVIQPAMCVDYEENCHVFFRSSSGLGKIYYTQFPDDKLKVENPKETNLLNPNSGVDVAMVGDRMFLIHNPNSTLRNPLVVSEIQLKEDSMTEFDIINEVVVRENIDESDRQSCITGELSYPYMIEHDGKLHLTYTYGRAKIEYCVIEV